MKSVRVRRFVLCVFFTGFIDASAQTGVVVRPQLRTDQILHVSTALEFSVNVNVEVGGQPGTAKIVNKALLAFKQTNRGADDKNRMEAQLTIERIESEEMAGGKTSANAAQLAALAGQTVSAFFDRDGKLVDVEVPKEANQASALIRQLVASSFSALNFLPAEPMTVGQTLTVPVSIPLRLPTNTSSGSYETKTATTLRGVDSAAGHRIAHLDQRTESSGAADQPKVAGTGTIDVNVDRGYIAASTIEWNVTGTYPAANQPAGARAGEMTATIKATTTANEETK